MGESEVREIFSRNLKKYMDQYDLNNVELSKIVGVSESTVGKWLLQKATPRMGAIEQMARYFGIQKSDLLEERTALDIFAFDNIIPVQTKRIPILGTIACGEPVFADEDWQGYVEAGEDLNADFALRAQGDSMINARIFDGDLVFIRKQTSVANGEIAAIIIEDEATLKRVFFHEDSGLLELRPENPAHRILAYPADKLDEIHILGKAVAFQSFVK